MTRTFRHDVRHCALAVLIALLLTPTGRGGALAATSCELLATLALPNTAVTSTELVAAGAFTAPGGRGGAPAGPSPYAGLPSFCRVQATAKPSSDSDIKIEVWLPASGWNGKLQAVGNRGWGGAIMYPALGQAVAAGYAGASTDTGHAGGGASFALGHPEKVVDSGYRAVHEMTVQAKWIIEQHYGSPAKFSYWNGCSLGGRQGLAAAQRYPADFDGIVVGDPVNNLTDLYGARLAMGQAVHRTPESDIPPDKYTLVHEAVLTACDASDGVRDGVLEDPTRCRFDPKALECKGEDGAGCLTPPQVESARALYVPVKHPGTGRVISSGLERGSELGWAAVAGPRPDNNSTELFRHVIFKDANWDPGSFKLTDVDVAARTGNGVLNAIDTNLKPFFDRGGKLLMYHGWSDPQTPPGNSIEYYNAVVGRYGREKAAGSIQIFMVPGMGHCEGGKGTDTFDKMGPLSQWVETGKAPGTIVASHLTDGKPDRTRPLCPYGSFAQWNGSRSTDDAANFSCAVQAR